MLGLVGGVGSDDDFVDPPSEFVGRPRNYREEQREASPELELTPEEDVMFPTVQTRGSVKVLYNVIKSLNARIDVGIPPKYVGGSVKWISDLDYDEWGIMTLWEKKRNRAAQAEIPAVEGEVQMNVLAAEGEVQVNVATAEEDNVQDFVATAADNDVQVNVAAIECLVEVNVVVADDGDVLVEVAAHYGDVPVNVVALYGDVPVNVGDFVMDFQQQQEVVQKKLALQI
nr:hypothetical protein Iba_chr03cCG3850 [Ipomoea batatas]